MIPCIAPCLRDKGCAAIAKFSAGDDELRMKYAYEDLSPEQF